MRQFRYLTPDGTFDYERYRRVQTEANHRKINSQWVDEAAIRALSTYIRDTIGQPTFGICHGTRRGLEQAWFGKFLGCRVIGTEISDTATSFPETIQWDFHEVKPEWLDAVDFIYSNSWDHSYDPHILFPAWMSCIRPGGLCLLEHSADHVDAKESDPLGMTLDELTDLLARLSNGRWTQLAILSPTVEEGAFSKRTDVRYLVLQRAA